MSAVRFACWTVLLSALLLSASDAAAQTRLAIVAGAAISELRGDDVREELYESRTGAHLGVYAEVPLLGRILVVEPGGMFVEKGFRPDAATSVKVSFLEIIAPVRLSLPIAGAVSFSIFAGPGFALGFGCLEKAEFSTEEGRVESTRDCLNSDWSLKSWDVIGIFGGGVSVPVSPRLSLVANGAVDTSLRSASTSESNLDLKNYSWLINAGVSFPLVRR